MKTSKLIVALTVVALTLWATGCKEETKSVTEQTKDAVAAASDSVARTVETAKDAGAKVVADVTDKARELAAPASAKAQELIDAAKNLVGEGKYQEALTKLKDLSSEKLSVAQQSAVDGLKAQIEKALGAGTKAATDAANAATGVLPKN